MDNTQLRRNFQLWIRLLQKGQWYNEQLLHFIIPATATTPQPMLFIYRYFFCGSNHPNYPPPRLLMRPCDFPAWGIENKFPSQTILLASGRQCRSIHLLLHHAWGNMTELLYFFCTVHTTVEPLINSLKQSPSHLSQKFSMPTHSKWKSVEHALFKE